MAVAVSRLHWDDDTVPHPHVEIPHVRGVPVRDAAPPGAEVHRFVPNRLGIAEPGSGRDVVHHIEGLDGDITRFRKLLRRLAQIPGVRIATDPDMTCSILLTQGVTTAALAPIDDRFQGSVSVVPSRLAEFPGGVQIVATTAVGDAFTDFADLVEDTLAGVFS